MIHGLTKTFMKLFLAGIAVVIIGAFLVATKDTTFKYEVHGLVKNNSAIWYTDSLQSRNDTLYYKNSDGSVVTIPPPYAVIVRSGDSKGTCTVNKTNL